MKKLIFPVLSILTIYGLSLFNPSFNVVKAEENPYTSDFVYELKEDDTYLIKEVREESIDKTNLRLYGTYNDVAVSEISSNLFNGCNSLTKVMVSSTFTSLPSGLLELDTVTTIEYTGSLEQFNGLNYQTNKTVIEYSCDEGFINYWNTYIRPTPTSSICDITEDTYNDLIAKYEVLNSYDEAIVNNYVDLGGEKISDSIEYLEVLFSPAQPSNKKTEISKSVTLSIIIGVAIFGMTSIAIFYLLMKKNIIS